MINVFLLSKQGVQLFRDVVLFVFDLCLSQFDCDVGISFAIDVSWMQISRLPEKISQDNKTGNLIMSKDIHSCTYPDDVYADEDIDGIVVRDVLEHSHVGVEAHVPGHVVRHLVHAQ